MRAKSLEPAESEPPPAVRLDDNQAATKLQVGQRRINEPDRQRVLLLSYLGRVDRPTARRASLAVTKKNHVCDWAGAGGGGGRGVVTVRRGDPPRQLDAREEP